MSEVQAILQVLNYFKWIANSLTDLLFQYSMKILLENVMYSGKKV